MKIVLSRKGFDSSSGGCPSPILPDGRFAAMPIPDEFSLIRYKDINLAGLNAGKLVADLTNGRLGGDNGAHLDPDLEKSSIKREPGWRPIFGQRGAAQGHLRNHGVGPGDLFLFYGLFRQTVLERSRYRWAKSAAASHIIWGWLQVEDVLEVTPALSKDLDWISYHPHFSCPEEKNNVIYLSKRLLELPVYEEVDAAGSGVFPNFDPALVLSTDMQKGGASLWELPGWCYPRNGVFPLTYHQKSERWMRSGSRTLLKAATRRQEFIIDTANFPEAIGWAASLLNSCN